MFRIVIYCEDKRLAPLLNALPGLIAGVPEVHPVVNVQPTKGGLKAKTNGSSPELFAQYLRANKITSFTAIEGKALIKAAGLNPASSSYHFRVAKRAGLLKSRGKGTKTIYEVLL